MVVVSNTLSLLPFSILPIITPWLANRKGIRRDYFFASSRSQLALMKAKGGSQVGKRRWKKEGDVGFFSRWKVNRDCVSYAIGIGIGFLIFLGNMTYREGGVSKSKNMYSAVSIHCAFSFSLVSTFEEKTPSSFHAP